MIQFWFATGLRPGEIIALRWDRIDWVNRKVRIDLNRVSKTDKGPKTEAGVRDVDLGGEALAALTAQKPASFLASAHVFLNPRNAAAWDTDAQVIQMVFRIYGKFIPQDYKRQANTSQAKTA